MKNKKAELTTQQIVMIIILVVSFSVLLIFLYNLLSNELTDKQICHDSVLKKAQGGILNEATLDCKTTYVCISGGGDCEKFSETEKKEVDLSGDVEKQVTKAIADEMADCWWMFGEGKVDYAGDFGGTHCGICAKIKFDKSVLDAMNNNFKIEDFYKKMSRDFNDGSSRDYSAYIYQKKDYSYNDVLNKHSGLSQNILFNKDDSYLIITGLDGDKKILGYDIEWFQNANYMRPVLIQTSDVEKLECDSFDLTKA